MDSDRRSELEKQLKAMREGDADLDDIDRIANELDALDDPDFAAAIRTPSTAPAPVQAAPAPQAQPEAPSKPRFQPRPESKLDRLKARVDHDYRAAGHKPGGRI